jgi:hypothetical protein
MTNEELIAHLRNSKGWPNLGNAAADRIEALGQGLKTAVAVVAESERMRRQAEGRTDRLEAALRWYEKRVSDCRKITREGEAARNELDHDGGDRARAALKREQQ